MEINENEWKSVGIRNQWKSMEARARGGGGGEAGGASLFHEEFPGPPFCYSRRDTSPGTPGIPFTASQKKVSTPKAQPNWGKTTKKADGHQGMTKAWGQGGDYLLEVVGTHFKDPRHCIAPDLPPLQQ